MDREAPLDEDDAAGLRALEALVDGLPCDRLDRAGAVAQHQLHEVVAVAAGEPAALPDGECRRDRVAVGEVRQEDAGRVFGLGRAEGGLNCKSRVHLAAKVMTESDAHFTVGVVVRART